MKLVKTLHTALALLRAVAVALACVPAQALARFDEAAAKLLK